MKLQAPVKIVLVDNHPVVVDGLRGVLATYASVEVVGVAYDVTSALSAIKKNVPDVILLDINLPGISGIDGIAMIKAIQPDCRIIMLSMHDSREYISSSIMRGAAGYLLKEVPTGEIVTAIEKVAGGQTYFSAGVRESLLDPGPRAEAEVLTQREQEVALLLAKGHSNRAIADMLAISDMTVATHRKHIKRKLGVSSTAELVRFVLEHPERVPTSG